ncbi:MAG: sigma-70 family RNA polymerase sigma factor [Bacteroidota bacterium]
MDKLTREPSTEDKIIHLLGQHDQQVIQLIYRHYGHNLFNVVYRIIRDEGSAQDVFQEVMIKIWRKGHSYTREKGSLYTWLLSVCKHAAIDYTRSKVYLDGQRHSGSLENSTAASARVNPTAEQHELREWVQKLPEKQRVLVEMAYFQGYTHEEISEKLDIPLGTVKTRIRIAIRELRKVVKSWT